MPFSLLFSNPKLLAGGVVIALALGYVGWLKFDNWGLENKIEKLEVHITALKADVVFAENETAKCGIQIDESNVRIIDLKESRVDRAEILDMLADNIKTITEITASNVKDIEDMPTPENCAEAMELLRQGVKP